MPLRSSYAYLYNSRPLNWTRPGLIHIEGDRGRDCPRDPPCLPRQEAAGEGSSAVLESRAPAPRPECVAEKDGPPRAGIGRAPGKATGRRLGWGVQLGPGMTTSHISYIIIR